MTEGISPAGQLPLLWVGESPNSEHISLMRRAGARDLLYQAKHFSGPWQQLDVVIVLAVNPVTLMSGWSPALPSSGQRRKPIAGASTFRTNRRGSEESAILSFQQRLAYTYRVQIKDSWRHHFDSNLLRVIQEDWLQGANLTSGKDLSACIYAEYLENAINSNPQPFTSLRPGHGCGCLCGVARRLGLCHLRRRCRSQGDLQGLGKPSHVSA